MQPKYQINDKVSIKTNDGIKISVTDSLTNNIEVKVEAELSPYDMIKMVKILADIISEYELENVDDAIIMLTSTLQNLVKHYKNYIISIRETVNKIIAKVKSGEPDCIDAIEEVVAPELSENPELPQEERAKVVEKKLKKLDDELTVILANVDEVIATTIENIKKINGIRNEVKRISTIVSDADYECARMRWQLY